MPPSTATAEAPDKPRDYDTAPPHSYGLITPRFWHGMLPQHFVPLVLRNGCRVSLRGAIASTTAFGAGCFHLLGAVSQQLIHGKRIARGKLSAPPLFVLGHWRSGTTLLHELLIRDPSHTYATTYECFAPHHFLTSEDWFPKLVPWLLPKKRPMDNMAAGWDRPQEDEFALCSLGLPTPYRSWAFPQHGPVEGDWLTLENLTDAERKRWGAALDTFVRAIAVRRPGRMVLKSPPHTARVKTLLEVFPDARFVHIARDPHSLFPSTVRLWRTLSQVQGLQRPQEHYDWIEEEVLSNLVKMYDAYERDHRLIPEGRLVEIRYEDLIESPKGKLREVYDQLGLTTFDQAEAPLDAHLASQRDYRTNRFVVPDDVRELVADRWGAYSERFGYA